MNKKLKAIAGVVAFVVFFIAAGFAYQMLMDRADAPDILAEVEGDFERAPDFAMQDAWGNEVRLSDFLGQPVVLNFWATWCPSCVRETPHFEALYQEMGDEVQIVKVNLIGSRGETRSTVDAFMYEGGYHFPLYFDTAGEGAQAYAVRLIPATFFITSEGYIAASVQGAVDEAALRSGVQTLKTK